MGPEVNKDPISLDDGRRRGVAVLRVDLARALLVEDLDVAEDPSIVSMKAQGSQGVAIVKRRGNPDLIALDDRRRPPASGHRHFPRDVFRFTPGQGEPPLQGVALPTGPAELRPVLGRQYSR